MIPVDHDVPEPGHPFPWRVGMPGFEIFRQVLYCFTNDLKVPDNSVLRPTVSEKLIIGHTGSILPDVACRFLDIVEKMER
jgi:hypothetical protein